jgi:ABC-type sugar transport system permease subunit
VWLLAAGALLLLILLPLGWLAYMSVSGERGLTLAHYARVFTDPRLGRALWNTVVLAFWSGLLSLAIGVAAYAVLYVFFVDGLVRPVISPEDRPAYALLSALNTMAWLFAILGFANRHLTRRPAFLAEATEAVYPFYMLHQTVTVIAVYWLLEIGAPPVAGFILAALATFLGTSAIYLSVVRPLWFIRPLFGLKAAYKNTVRPPSSFTSRSRRMPTFSSER